ncbi:MAG: hypothetical protein H6667_16995 [Ardenticatenaceae bacterium]|nr:hypothetical protein [Ardenticatenaceae bacterium]MCB9443149.1 hypothetical protein [Ardenticatenaceae bacterium]
MKPSPYQKIAIVSGLLIVLVILIASNIAVAQDDSLIWPVVGAAPGELLEPGSLWVEPESLQAGSALTATVYLPIVLRPNTCDLNPQELEIANFAIQHPDQGRPFMNCDPILAQVARERALDMGTRNYFSHTNPDGYGPNYLVRQAGYVLPTWYGAANDANNIESIAAGYTTASAAWTGWLNSAGHRAHVLAEDPFWAAQTNYGIGYAYVPGSTYQHYWVFISAPPEP